MRIEIKKTNEVTFFGELTVEFSPREQVAGKYRIEYEYDFGMSDAYVFHKGTVFLGITPELTDEEIVRRVVEYDIDHAFGHPNCDPNYNHTHWALYGNLWGRIKSFN